MNTDYMKYPKEKDIAVGNKVSWLYYDNEDDAKAAAKAAVHNAELDEQRGYDFGFMAPGEITKVPMGWKVCIP